MSKPTDQPARASSDSPHRHVSPHRAKEPAGQRPRKVMTLVSTVMVVDDEQRIRKLISRSLSSAGHNVLCAADGFRALDRLESEEVDLVLLDLIMPGCNGLTVLSSMRQRENTTPVIVLTAGTDVATRVEALDRGAGDVVAKPFSLAELLARPRRHLEGAPVAHSEPRFVSAAGIRLDLE